MTISYYDFKNLSDQAQCDIVMNQGHLMNETVVKELKYLLYEVSLFSVEIIYNTKNDRIAGMNIYQNKAVYSN
ncbi:hypothetical protein [Epilithonimonas sp. UC225_85]|uniref:hypothetical protein n=1 Tax=Epilithonimonas sp. UC225_85 TaxID=3350167 RepID=UPI0036D215D1